MRCFVNLFVPVKFQKSRINTISFIILLSVFTIIIISCKKSFERFPGKTSNFAPKADFKMQFTVYFVINFTQLDLTEIQKFNGFSARRVKK